MTDPAPDDYPASIWQTVALVVVSVLVVVCAGVGVVAGFQWLLT